MILKICYIGTVIFEHHRSRRIVSSLKPGLWIRIHFLRIRIRIQWIRMEANTDPDTDPDPDPDPIRIQALMTKN